MNVRILTIVLICGTLSCAKALIEPNKDATPSNTFDQLWNDINDKYVFFNLKNVDWDSVRQVHENRLSDGMSDKALFDVLSEVVLSLKDGHTSLYSPLDTTRFYFYENAADNFNEDFVLNTYLQPNGYRTSSSIRHCLLNGNIAYWYYPSFEKELTEEKIDDLLSKYTDSKGLIIDIRHNTGGDNDNIYRLMEHFIESKTLIGFSQEKANDKPNNFTSPYPIYIEPKGVNYTKPILLLTNRRVYSSANIFAGFMQQLPHVKLVGDTTGGGTGIPTSNQLPNGWLYRYSSSFVRLVGTPQFETGVIPDFVVSTGEQEENMGIDALIEHALKEF